MWNHASPTLWEDNTEDRQIRYWCPQKTHTPLIRNGSMQAYLIRDSLEPPAYGEKLVLTIHVFGDTPCMRAFACLAHNKWGLQNQIQVVKTLQVP